NPFIRGDYSQTVLDTYKEELAAAEPPALLGIATLTYPECENGVIPLNKPTISYAERRANYNKETTPDGVNKADLDLVDNLHLKYDSSSLKPENKNRMDALLSEYKSRVFSHSDIDFGCTDMIEHSIQLLPGSRPIKQTMRTFPQAMEQEAKKEIEKYLKYGVISRTISEWGSPALLVRKPDGTIRFCLDYRLVNRLVKTDTYNTPNQSVLLSKLGHARYFSTFDLTSGYWAVPMEESSKDVTAFTCSEGVFRFEVSPFGLASSSSVFCRFSQVITRP
ncbi:MAG: RNA-directed DNA polymerase, partial [Desulfobacteraceae bacterium]|nr:RNA-directed DNA polymerase [Desulfobacteraceae bacterium]